MYLILLGPPGTGKGTQAKIIADQLGLAHVATGDMFRQAVQQQTTLGREAKSYMEKGDLVPDDLTVSMLLERISQPDAQQGVLFDGFPRTLEQARALDAALASEQKQVDAAIHVSASDEEIIRRLTGRWLCNKCGEIYHQESRRPKEPGRCDLCGNELSQRDDDRPEVVQRRLERQRPPEAMLDYFREQGKLHDVNGEQEMAAVTRDLLATIERVSLGRAEKSGRPQA